MGDRVDTASTPVVEVRGLSKEFGGVYALRDVSLAVQPGEIHGLLGQNGSGKSTLIKILSGYHVPEDGGELLVNGRDVPLPLRPGRFQDLGISFVHQDLGLVESRSVLDNLLVGRYRTGVGGKISWRQARRSVRDTLKRFDLAIDPDTQVAKLQDVERALIAIARAQSDVEATNEAGLLVLDEPTVYLPRNSVERLFGAMRDVAAEGHGILFVSHQLDEVKAITDRVSVLRDGRLVGEAPTADTSESQLIHMILGRELTDLYPTHVDTVGAEALLSVRGLAGGLAEEVSFDVRPGEILGLTGLIGTGFEDVPYLVYGAQKARAGELEVDGVRLRAADASPARSIGSGMVMVPANRLRDAIVATRTVEDNVVQPKLREHFRGLRLRLREAREDVKRALVSFDVRPPDPQRIAMTLSGGNQQKAVLAKWVQTSPSVLLMHEPTQGVDVGARKQIFALISDTKETGTAVVVASSEHEDLAGLCDRVLVFREGRVASEIEGAALTTDRIVDESYRSVSTA